MYKFPFSFGSYLLSLVKQQLKALGQAYKLYIVRVGGKSSGIIRRYELIKL